MNVAVMLFLLPLTAAAVSDCRQVTTADGTVAFSILQDGVPFSGTFQRYGGKVCFNDGAIALIDVWLAPASVDTGLPELDAALRDPEFFASDRYPRITFRSSVVRREGGRWHAQGMLTVKGKTQDVTLPFTLVGGRDVYRVSGNLTLDRARLRIGTGEWSDTRWLAKDVQVKFDVALVPGGEAATQGQ